MRYFLILIPFLSLSAQAKEINLVKIREEVIAEMGGDKTCSGLASYRAILYLLKQDNAEVSQYFIDVGCKSTDWMFAKVLTQSKIREVVNEHKIVKK